MTTLLDPAALLRRLHEAEVRCVVIGGFAVIAHGVQRATADLDICPDPDPANLSRLASLLDEIDARQVGDFTADEFPYDPTDPGQLAEGGRHG